MKQSHTPAPSCSLPGSLSLGGDNGDDDVVRFADEATKGADSVVDRDDGFLLAWDAIDCEWGIR